MSSYLNELCRFYGRMTSDPASGMPPEGMTAEFISFALVLSEDGELVRVEDLRDSRGKPIRQFVPAAVKRSVNIAANFLWDNTGYVLGVDDKGKQERSKQTAESFRHLHRNVLAGCEKSPCAGIADVSGQMETRDVCRTGVKGIHAEQQSCLQAGWTGLFSA